MDAESGRTLLKSLIEDVTASDARRYGVTDDLGRTMDCAKIVEDTGPDADANTDTDTTASATATATATATDRKAGHR